MIKKLMFSVLPALFLLCAVNTTYSQDLIHWYRAAAETEVKVEAVDKPELEVQKTSYQLLDSKYQVISEGTISEVMTTLQVIKKNTPTIALQVRAIPREVIRRQKIKADKF